MKILFVFLLTVCGFMAYGADVATRRPVITQLQPWSAGDGFYEGCSVLSIAGDSAVPVIQLISTNMLQVTDGHTVNPSTWYDGCEKVIIYINDPTNATYANLVKLSVAWAYLDYGNEGDPRWYQSNGISTNLEMLTINRGQAFYFDRKYGTPFTNMLFRGLLPMDATFSVDFSAARSNAMFYFASGYPSMRDPYSAISNFSGMSYGPEPYDTSMSDSLLRNYTIYRDWMLPNQWMNGASDDSSYGMVYIEEGPYVDQIIGPLWWNSQFDPYNPFDPKMPFKYPFLSMILQRPASASGTVSWVQSRPY